ncbi:MAG: hypothetical protein NTZ46_05565 [Verrucomicrobia bacterium]|nr:hypothetical protein [Verrucomicrobiota bacterium]
MASKTFFCILLIKFIGFAISVFKIEEFIPFLFSEFSLWRGSGRRTCQFSVAMAGSCPKLPPVPPMKEGARFYYLAPSVCTEAPRREHGPLFFIPFLKINGLPLVFFQRRRRGPIPALGNAQGFPENNAQG